MVLPTDDGAGDERACGGVRVVPLPPGLTAYLDLVRVVAAVAVWMSHYLPAFGFGREGPAYGHDAVVVFFVLSGLVVALVADTRRRGPVDYALSRLVRLWSVAVPALLIGMCMQAVLGEAGGWPRAAAAAAANLVFLGEWWWGSVGAPSNPPYWSLNYEAWFYACFGVAVFVRGRWRWPLAAGMCVAAGPAILALAPCWLAGVAVYRWRSRLRLRPGLAVAVFLASIVAVGAIDLLGLADASRAWLRTATGGLSYRLGASQAWLSDYALTLAVCANFVAALSLPGMAAFSSRIAVPVGRAAAYTLSFYLYHMPMLVLIRAAAGPSIMAGRWALPVTLLASAAAMVLLARGTELQRYRLKRALAGWRPFAAAAGLR